MVDCVRFGAAFAAAALPIRTERDVSACVRRSRAQLSRSIHVTNDERRDAELIALIIAVQELLEDSPKAALVLRHSAQRIGDIALASALTDEQIDVVERGLRRLAGPGTG